MKFNYHYNANLAKLLIALSLLFNFNVNLWAQDPINDALRKEKQELSGIAMNPQEERELEKINKKYQISDREKELRIKQQTGQKIGFLDKFRMGKANRKDYMRNKKMQKFNRKVILNRQNEATRKRMIENEKRIKARDKQINRKQKRKKFLHLFS